MAKSSSQTEMMEKMMQRFLQALQPMQQALNVLSSNFSQTQPNSPTYQRKQGTTNLPMSLLSDDLKNLNDKETSAFIHPDPFLECLRNTENKLGRKLRDMEILRIELQFNQWVGNRFWYSTQSTTVSSYYRDFCEWKSWVDARQGEEDSEAFLVRIFVRGLREEIKTRVCMSSPTSVAEAFRIASMVEVEFKEAINLFDKMPLYNNLTTHLSIGNEELKTDENKGVVPILPRNIAEVRVLQIKDHFREEQELKEICFSEYTNATKFSNPKDEVYTDSFDTHSKGFVRVVSEQFEKHNDGLFAVDVIEFQVVQFYKDSLENFTQYQDYMVFHKWRDIEWLIFRDVVIKSQILRALIFEDVEIFHKWKDRVIVLLGGWLEGCKSVAAGLNAMDLRRGVTIAVNVVVSNLTGRDKMISTSEEIAQVSTISVSGEREIGESIAKAMEKVGKKGVIPISNGRTLYNELEVAEERKFDRGYIFLYFINNQKSLEKRFGQSPIFIVAIFMENGGITPSTNLATLLKEAIHVISYGYEDKSEWGKEIGWIFGLVTEDILTGFKMHARGWISVYCVSPRPAFKGSAPINLSDRLNQVLRWALGSIEILLSRHCPIWYGYSGRLKPLERLTYINTIVYPLTSLPLIAYCMLSAFYFLTEKFIIPAISNLASMWFILLFVSIFAAGILELRWSGVGIEDWWRNAQFWVIGGTSAHFFAVFQGLLKVLAGIDTNFTVTSKASDEDGKFFELYVFKWTSLLILPTTILIMNMAGIVVGVSYAINSGYQSWGSLFGKLFFSIWSYKWEEILSADAFSTFEDVGLEDSKAVKETGYHELKTVDIVLDCNFVSMVRNVGLARLVTPLVADVVTQYQLASAAGTFGYIDPEYKQSGEWCTKSDYEQIQKVVHHEDMVSLEGWSNDSTQRGRPRRQTKLPQGTEVVTRQQRIQGTTKKEGGDKRGRGC